MTQVISLDIYRTENIRVVGKSYTIRFAVTRDGQEHALMVSNDTTNQQNKYHFSSEVAADFKHYHNEELLTEILKIIQDDIENNLL